MGDIVEYIKSENFSTRQESVLYNHEMNGKIHKGNLFIVHKAKRYKSGEEVIFIQLPSVSSSFLDFYSFCFRLVSRKLNQGDLLLT